MLTERARSEAPAPGKVLIPLPVRPTEVTAVRGTLLCTSLVGLHNVGMRERYLAELPPRLHGEMMGLTASEWVPTDLAHAHYSAIERMQLPADLVTALTDHLNARLRSSLLATAFTLARALGATPLTLLNHSPQTWAKVYQGGSIGLSQLGPCHVRVHVLGLSLMTIPCFAKGVRGMYERMGASLASRVQVTSPVRSTRASEWLLDVSWS